MDHESCSGDHDPKDVKDDDDSTNKSLCVSSSDGSHIKFSENKQALFSTLVMENADDSSQHDC